MKNIFFVGKAGSGKSSLAFALAMNYKYTHVRFAAPLYSLAYEYFNMDKTVKDRKLLQIMGTEVGRMQFDKDIWVKRLIQDTQIVQETCKQMGYPERYFVLDDCRFPNEYSALRAENWVGIYLDVSEADRCARLMQRDGQFNLEHFKHASETEIDTFKDFLVKVDASRPLQLVYEDVLKIAGI
jgi:adenylate kinase family enzyme